MNSDPLNVHLTATEVAKRLRRSISYLQALRRAGTGPKYIPGRPVLYPITEIEKWEQESLVNSTANKSCYPDATRVTRLGPRLRVK